MLMVLNKLKKMSILKTQFGESLTADFQENTWTFEMPTDFKVFAGDFAIVPKENFLELVKALKGISNSIEYQSDYLLIFYNSRNSSGYFP